MIDRNNHTADVALDWPMFRHNFKLTGRSEGKGSMQSPGIVAETVYADGDNVKLWMEDINLDGESEYVFVEGGRIRVRNKDGKLLWESAVCDPLIIGFHDLDGLGQEKYIVAVTDLRKLTLFSSSTGDIVWEYVFEEKTVLLSHFRIQAGKINHGLTGEQITVWPEGDCYGYLFSFENGAANGRLVWQCRGIGIGDGSRYRPNILVGDVHGKGKNVILVIQHSRIWVVDAETGRLTQEIEGPDMRNYGYAGLFDVDNDGTVELVLVNDAVQLHVSVIKMLDGEFVYLWDKYIGYTDYVMKAPHLPVCDVDGDGRMEILYSVGDIAANEWQTEILDSATGKLKRVIKGARILDCGDVDGDGNHELLLERTNPSEFVICKPTDTDLSDLTELFRTEKKILTILGAGRSLWYNHIKDERENGYLYDVNGDGYLELLVVDQEVTRVYGCNGTGAFHVKNVITGEQSWRCLCAYLGTGRERFGLLYGKERSLQELSAVPWKGNQKVLYIGTGELLAKFVCVADNSAQIPIVTDIDKDGYMEIMVCDSVFTMNRHVDAEEQEVAALRLKWQLNPLDAEGSPIMGGADEIRFLAAWDFNGDGQKELLYANVDAELILTDSKGAMIWRRRLKDNFRGGRILSCSVGRFLSEGKYDIFANVSAASDYMNECMVIEALSGDVVWRRNDGHERGMGPLDGYAAVAEFQEDGRDDLLFISSDTLCCVDGKTGIDLHEKKDLGGIMGTRWLGQGHLVLLDVDKDGEDEAYLSGVWGLNGGILKWRGCYWQPRWFDYYGNSNPIGTPPRHSHQGIAVAGAKLLAGGPRSDYRFGCINLSNGDLLWTYDLGDHLVSEVCTGDIDGDGFDEFVFSCSDGFVYSLKHTGELHFKVFTSALPGSPVLADVDGDGLLEILVTTNQGKLLVIK